MNNSASKSLLEQLQWRAAVKNYDTSRKLSDQQVQMLVEAMNLAPSAFGLQPYKFYVVSDPQVKAQIAEAGYHQPQITESSHLIVLASALQVTAKDVEAFADNITKTRGVSKEDIAGYVSMMEGFVSGQDQDSIRNWAARQVYIPLGVLVAAASAASIDSSPMEGFDAQAVDQILHIQDEGFTTRAMVAVGYRSADDQYGKMAKVRKPLSEVVTFLD